MRDRFKCKTRGKSLSSKIYIIHAISTHKQTAAANDLTRDGRKTYFNEGKVHKI